MRTGLARPRLGRLTIALLVATSAVTVIPTNAAGAPFGGRTLKVGVKGKDVKALQRAVTTLGATTPANGVFTAATRKAVRKIEVQLKLSADGVVVRKEAKRILRAVSKRKSAKPPAVFFTYGMTNPNVVVTAQLAGSASLEVIDTNTGLVTKTLPLTFTAAGPQTVAWNGIAATNLYAPDSTYQFKIPEPGTAVASISSGQTLPFVFRNYAFPVPGAHSFGGAGSRFGAPRGGRTHQGQDVSAACGQPLLAAQGGTVKVKAYQAGGAGYYLVIAGTVSGTDTVYMHMKKPSYLLQGQIVYTGQQIGKVGNTGSSSGCHLHFEHWANPGWYSGGYPYDPLAELTYWDGYS